MGTPTTGTTALSRITDPQVQRFLGDKWETIAQHFQPLHLILFGSRINGVPHLWSDIDLIIVSARFEGMRFIKRSYYFKTVVQPDVGVTALCYTPAEFERARCGIGVVADACREGCWRD